MGWSAARSWPGSSTSSSRTVWVDGAAEACPPSGLASSPSAGASGAPSRSSLTRPPPRGARRARSGTVLSAGRSGRLLAPSRCAERESCPSAYPEEVGGSGISLRRWQALPRFGRVNSRHGEPDSSPRPAEARRTDRREQIETQRTANRVVDLEVVDRLREFELHALALADLHDLLALEVVDEDAEARVLGVPRGAALGGRADVGGEADHLLDGRDALNDHQVALLVHVVDAAAATLDLTGRGAHVLRGDVDPDVLNRLQQADLAVDQRAVDRVADGGDDLRGPAVDGVLVELRVVQAEQRPLDRLGGERPVVEGFLKPFEDELHRLVEVLDPLRVVDEDVRPVDVLDVLGGVLVHAGVLQRLAALQFGHVHRDLTELDGVDDLLVHRLDRDVELVVAVRRDALDLARRLLGLLAVDDDRFAGDDRDALVVADPLVITLRWSSPCPLMRCSPVSSLISIWIVGSSFATCWSVSMSFGRSSMFCASTDFVMTGSEMCSIDSNGVISTEETVEPAMASRRPVTDAMLPAGTCSTSSRSDPMKSTTLWMRFLPAVPETYSSWPFSSVPEKTRPVAISPACGSIEMSVTMKTTSRSSSTSCIPSASSESGSPRQMRGTRRGWASTGFGKCSQTMSSTTSDSGVRSWSSSRLSFCSSSMMSPKSMPVRCIEGIETPHLYSAEPNPTVPSSTETVQSSGMSSMFSAIPRMSSLTSAMTDISRSCISWGPSWSSLMRRSTLLMNSVGFTPSRSGASRPRRRRRPPARRRPRASRG